MYRFGGMPNAKPQHEGVRIAVEYRLYICTACVGSCSFHGYCAKVAILHFLLVYTMIVRITMKLCDSQILYIFCFCIEYHVVLC